MSAQNPGIQSCVFLSEKQSLAALKNSAHARTEIPTLRGVLTLIERRACMLEMISAQPTATLRHQSVQFLEHVAVFRKWIPKHGAKPLFK